MALTLRDARDGDWPGMWRVMRPILAAGETFSWDRDTPEEEARRTWTTSPPGATFVAVDDAGRVLGTATMGPNHGGPAAHVATAGFMVDPEAGGRGVGRALGEHVLERARSAGFVAMQFNAVVESNHRAVALWTSLGFEVLATVPDAFRHPRHGLVGLHIMFRRL